MAAYSLYATLSLPALSTFPSAKCIQWSEDGQAIILTRQAIVILVHTIYIHSNQSPSPVMMQTPALGIVVEPSSVVKQSLDRKETSDHKQHLGWYKTIIERQKSDEPHHWAMECQGNPYLFVNSISYRLNSLEWSAVSLGLLDVSFFDVSCSPSNLSEDAWYFLPRMSSLATRLMCIAIVAFLPFWTQISKCLSIFPSRIILQDDGNGYYSFVYALYYFAHLFMLKVGGLLNILDNIADDVANNADTSNLSLLRTLHKQISGMKIFPFENFNYLSCWFRHRMVPTN
jgi:hypothetical protein